MNKIEYKLVAIKDIGIVVTGKTPLTANEEYYNGPYMFISPNELHGGYLISKSEKTITAKGLESIKTNSINGISVLVGCIGWDMGNVAMCFEKCATNQQINSITSFKNNYNPYYIYYWLSTKKEYLFSIASVTRTPILSKGTFQDVLVPIPKKSIQDKIVNVLLSIDKKISNNNQISDILRAQLNDFYLYNFYKKQTNGTINELLIENEKSNIQVSDAKTSNGAYPFFTSGEAILEWDEALVDGRNCFLNTGGNADVKFYVGKAAYSTDTWCITAKKDLSDYLYLLLNTIKVELNKKFFQGTGLKHLQKELLKERPIYIPSEEEVKSFNEVINPILNMISEKTRENQELADLRDWLLPMLMNGQATVE